MSASALDRAVLLNGSVGTGKTSTAFALGTALEAAGLRGAVIDLDHLATCWPAPPDDPFRFTILLENLAAVARVYARNGMTSLVLAGVVENAEQRRLVGDALGLAPTLIRLTAPDAVLVERVAARAATDEERDWHVARAPELAAILDRADVDDHVVSTLARPRGHVVREIMALLGWVGAGSR